MNTIALMINRPDVYNAYRMIACAKRWRQRGNRRAAAIYLGHAARCRRKAKLHQQELPR